jgi:predicted RNA-binding protein YlxR (DUF448 family)
VALDPGGRIAGRGAYVCDEPACRERAIRAGALTRALSAPLPAAVSGGLATDQPTSADRGAIDGTK